MTSQARWTSDHEAGFNLLRDKLREALDQAHIDWATEGDNAHEALVQVSELVGDWEWPTDA